MGLKVKLLIIIQVENIDVIFMSENVAVSQLTNHVDVGYKFVQKFLKISRILFLWRKLAIMQISLQII